jgi:hypothetical protein
MAKRVTRRQKAVTSETSVSTPMAAEAADRGAVAMDTRESATPAAAPELTSSSMGSEPSEADVRMRAYQRYLERGASHGQDFDDWVAAEQELKNGR